ncbi:unnamed protein product, partial [marine sediment metagenome]
MLKQIIDETGGKLVPAEIYERLDSSVSPNCWRDSNRCRLMRVGGRYFALTAFKGSLDEVTSYIQLSWKVLDKYRPPLISSDRPLKFWLADFCHFAGMESDSAVEKTDEN